MIIDSQRDAEQFWKIMKKVAKMAKIQKVQFEIDLRRTKGVPDPDEDFCIHIMNQSFDWRFLLNQDSKEFYEKGEFSLELSLTKNRYRRFNEPFTIRYLGDKLYGMY